MTSITPDHTPALFAGRPPIELLVPVALQPDHQPGLTVVADLARSWGLPIRMLHVSEEGPASEARFTELVRSFKARHPELVVANQVVEVGLEADPAAIVSAHLGDRSLIFLPSERASQWLEEPSVAESVVGAAEQMLVLAGPRCIEPKVGSSVVAALDGSDRAEKTIAPAAAVAAASQTKLWLVTAVSEATARTVAELRERGQDVSESAYLRAVATRLEADGVDVGWQLVHDDDPVAGLISFAINQGASMIVAASHGETGVARRLFGSVCMGLVERAAVPILVVKAGDVEAIPLAADSD